MQANQGAPQVLQTFSQAFHQAQLRAQRRGQCFGLQLEVQEVRGPCFLFIHTQTHCSLWDTGSSVTATTGSEGEGVFQPSIQSLCILPHHIRQHIPNEGYWVQCDDLSSFIDDDSSRPDGILVWYETDRMRGLSELLYQLDVLKFCSKNLAFFIPEWKHRIK